MADHKTSKSMARKLPEYVIGGTLFTVDARIYEFRETAAPWNIISMKDFWEDDSTVIPFDKEKKNIYDGNIKAGERPENVEIVTVPPIIELDPIGLARHYNLADGTFIPKENREKTLSEQLIGLQQNTRTRKNGRGVK
ncbi:hypothetical protein KXD93_06490 [Mucilaginibacter sp. BJC16-A38]|uniref:hypothetical protein n=1 Tax=Mucilaginibacter phenanthrenivorans TaxID=1234842 RepID=UPI0021583AB2|nr:hypothetical protein [Mucilaginibacter phenanthrenivorans]MCR8557280.1 hypothetical protein [Mucilaginibacter phenanthrenivorans]